jgi:hypothetical protein
MAIMKIKICVFLVCIMACFSGYAFASWKSTSRVEKKMHLVYLKVMQSDLDNRVKALVVLSLPPAFARYHATTAFKHMDWPWEDDDDEDKDDDEDDDNGGNEFTCVLDAISTLITDIKVCDSNFACILSNVFDMVLEIEACSE